MGPKPLPELKFLQPHGFVKVVDTIPPKLMVRLHHAHPSNAAPEFVLGRSFSILDLDKTEDALFLCHLTYQVRLDAFDVSF